MKEKTRRTFATLAAVSLAWAGPAAALTGTIVVKGPKATCATSSPANVVANGGWAFAPNAGASFDLLPGPLPPPAGVGSLEESVAAAGPVMAAVNLNPILAGAPLGSLALLLAGISYANLDISTFTGALPAFAVFVDLPGGGAPDDTIVFFPAANSCAGFGAWTPCPVLAGVFFGSNPAADPDGNLGTPFTFVDYVVFNPAALLPALPNPGFGFLLGAGPVFGAAAAYVDDFTLDAVAPLAGPFDDIRYDFEPDCSAYGTDADADCYCETLNPTVLIFDQCDGSPPSSTSDDNFDANGDFNNDTDGDGVHECLDVCFTDPAKTFPGACGCGVPDTDTDGDTVADCIDNCPDDPNPDQADVCTCTNVPATAGCTVNGVSNQPCQGGPGADEIVGTPGPDVIHGGGGDDVLRGGDGDDLLCGEGGSDALQGGEHDDTLVGGEDDDQLSGARGDDTLLGGEGDDLLNGGVDADELDGGPGADTLGGGGGPDTLWGRAGNDVLNGGAGNDVLDGGDDDDTLHGAGGADTLAGGPGTDQLHGGTGGSDTCSDVDQAGPFPGCEL